MTGKEMLGTSAIARAAGCSEDYVRTLDRRGVIKLERDSGGRRQGNWRDVETIRAYRARPRAEAKAG